MKNYPSIPKEPKPFGELFHVFDKLDGSNLRFEYDPKRGWYKFGTRTRLLDENDSVLGRAKPLFLDMFAASIEETARQKRWQSVVVFAEFYGPRSFAGQHEPSDIHTLRLFDVAPFKQGILGPCDFLDLFGHLPIAACIGLFTWDAVFLESVRSGRLPGITSEGVVGKRGSGHHLEMVKAKTDDWIRRVRERYTPAEADKIISS
jgi:hypothetical protein